MRRGITLCAGALGVAAGFAAFTTPAGAVNSIVSVDVGQPRAEIATTVNVRTITDVPAARLYIKTRATGGPPCAPSPRTDPGTTLSGFDGYGGDSSVGAISPGDRTQAQIITFQEPGSFQFCGWLYQDAGTFGTDVLIASTSGTFTVASPVGAITGVAVPLSVVQNRPFVVDVSGQAEVTRRLYTAWRPAPSRAVRPARRWIPTAPRTSRATRPRRATSSAASASASG